VRATIATGSERLKAATLAAQAPRKKAHSNSEPSCAPQTAETL